MNSNCVYPGDMITAGGHTFSVWIILYQDDIFGTFDVEFLDIDGGYHHWKQPEDGGHVIHTALPGWYYSDPDDRSRIGCIRPARTRGYTVRVMHADGSETFYGRTATVESAEHLLRRHGAGWQAMP